MRNLPVFALTVLFWTRPFSSHGETGDVTVDTRDVAATVINPSATSRARGATLGGNVTRDGGAAIMERGVVYSATGTNSNPLVGGAGVTKVAASGSVGMFTVTVTGLTPGSSYSFKAYAINSQGTSYTSVASFNTLLFDISGVQQSVSSGSLTTSTDNGTDFGNVVLGQVRSRVFTLTNSGTQPVTLTGSQLVEVEGDHATDFNVTMPPGMVVPAGGSTSFEVRFAPTQPGVRQARVKIASLVSASFVVQGSGVIPKLRSQVIAFTPPSTVYLSQSPLRLVATASSGLPVSFRLISGPASLGENGIFTPASAGTVKVEAWQAGELGYTAASSVQRTITVKTEPAALALVDLVKTYNGNPQAAGTVGAAPAWVELSYRVGGVYRTEPPTAAGVYPVKASAGDTVKSGTMIINPAPLVLTAENKRRLVGEPNPTLTSNLYGLIGGDTVDSVLIRPATLSTTATPQSPAGSYSIHSRGGEVTSNYKIVYRPGTLVVEGAGGSYEALLKDPDRGQLNGHLTVTVPASSRTFTASLRLGRETASISWRGGLSLDDQGRLATATVNKTAAGVVYELKVGLSTFGELSCEVRRAGVLVAAAGDGIRLLSLPVGQRAEQEGVYTAVMEPAYPAGAAVPAGAGWATVKVNATGRMSLTGKLADGTAFTAGLSGDVGEKPGYRLFVQPYLPKRTESFIAGALKLRSHPDFVTLMQVEAAGLTWNKLGMPGDLAYQTGFGPATVVMKVDPWQAPVAANPLVNRLALRADGLVTVEHSSTGSLSDGMLPTMVDFGSDNLVSVVTPLSNPRKWTVKITPSTGTYTGSFELLDVTEVRKVSFSGVLRQAPTGTASLIGAGHYLLPALKSTATEERKSGAVLFRRAE